MITQELDEIRARVEKVAAYSNPSTAQRDRAALLAEVERLQGIYTANGASRMTFAIENGLAVAAGFLFLAVVAIITWAVYVDDKTTDCMKHVNSEVEVYSEGAEESILKNKNIR